MGKLIKNHWARLIVLTAAAIHFAASISAFFWPKIFFDFLTTNFDAAVKPVPILQIINLLLSIATLAYEWPMRFLAGSSLHTSMEARMVWLPLVSLSSMLLYQGSNAALYYFIALVVYFWGYAEGEIICAIPWTLPRRPGRLRPEKF